MSITSNAFGRVKLTGKDAERFNHLMRYGRPTAASRAAVSEGVKLARELNDKGSVTFKIPGKKRASSK